MALPTDHSFLTVTYVAHIFAYSSIDAHEVMWGYAICMEFEGHTFSWHTFCSSLVNIYCSLLTFDGCVQ